LSGCNTGCRDATQGGACLAEFLPELIPSTKRHRQYRCTVHGTKGYQRGSNAGKNSDVEMDYTGPHEYYPPYQHSETVHLPRITMSTADDPTYRGFRGAKFRMKVTLTDTATGFRLRLDARRARLVTKELAHEQRSRPHRLGIGPTSEPCCLIVVKSDTGRECRYELFDGTVVLQVSSNLSWQFFAGMVLMDWLRQAQPPRLSPPFQPAVP
jgi:hypothetical protein